MVRYIGRLTCAMFLATTVSQLTAATWVESGDAGDLPVGAQITTGAGSLTGITGTLPTDSDVDMYRINITDKANFVAAITPLTMFIDPDIWLFDASGYGVSSNNLVAGGWCSVTGANVPANGTYYLAITSDKASAISSGGDIWLTSPYHGEISPNGPGAAFPITSWGGTPLNDKTSYSVYLAGAEFASVPEPGALAVLAGGSLGLLGRRGRDKR